MRFDQWPIHKYILLVEMYLRFSLFTCFHIGYCFDKNTLKKSFPPGKIGPVLGLFLQDAVIYMNFFQTVGD